MLNSSPVSMLKTGIDALQFPKNRSEMREINELCDLAVKDRWAIHPSLGSFGLAGCGRCSAASLPTPRQFTIQMREINGLRWFGPGFGTSLRASGIRRHEAAHLIERQAPRVERPEGFGYK